MLRILVNAEGPYQNTAWSILKSAAIIVLFWKFGPLLLSILSTQWNGVSVVASIGCLSRIPEAVETVREEKHQIETERAAFERFSTEILNLNAHEALGSDTDGLLLRKPDRPVGDTTETVRSLYRETIMSVEHYEEEYDETLRTNITAELGPDFETAVMTDDTLNQPLLDALARKSTSVAQDREKYTARVESELQSLTDAQKQLQNMTKSVERIRDWDTSSQSFEELEDAENELQVAKRECKTIIESRQTEYVDAPEEDGLNFRDYLYQQYEWNHPVVGDALDTIKNIQVAERRIATAVFDRF